MHVIAEQVTVWPRAEIDGRSRESPDLIGKGGTDGSEENGKDEMFEHLVIGIGTIIGFEMESVVMVSV